MAATGAMAATIVMTGATSGIGAVAAARLGPGNRLIVGARNGNVAGAETLPLDLASLASVRGFANNVVAALAGGTIDALVLNAGVQFADVTARSAEGYELTFATNHLSHYLLIRLLLPHLGEGGRIVMTTSDTHDPAEKTIVAPPNHADADRLAHPDRDPARDTGPLTAAMRAYSTSKLCNLMTVRSLAVRPEVTARRLTVLAYSPGLTPSTGLARSLPFAIRTLAWPLLPLLQGFMPFMNSLKDAGSALAALASDVEPPPGRGYTSLRKGVLTWPDPSLLARDDAVAARLWADSARLVGLPG